MILVCILIYYLVMSLNVYQVICKRRESRLLVLITWIILFLAYSFNSGRTGDAYFYKIDYEQNAFGTNWTELGYGLLKTLCYILGLHSYNQFLIALFLISSVLVFLGMRKLKGNYHALFVVSMGFIFPALAVAIRYSIAIAVFVFCLNYLFEGKRLKYTLGVLIASTFHGSALFFLLFLLCFLPRSANNRKTLRKILLSFISFIGITSTICALYTMFFHHLPFESFFSDLLLKYADKFIPNAAAKVESYFGSITRFGSASMLIIHISNFALAKRLKDCSHRSNQPDAIVAMADMGYLITIASTTLLPLTVLNLVFFRLYIAETIVNAIVFGRILQTERRDKKGELHIGKRTALFFIVFLSWMVPALFTLHGISVKNMISASLLFK